MLEFVLRVALVVLYSALLVPFVLVAVIAPDDVPCYADFVSACRESFALIVGRRLFEILNQVLK